MTKEKTNNLDFPFYKENPRKLNFVDIIILSIVPILFTLYTFFPFRIPFGMGSYLFTILQLLAFLFVARGKISLLIQKPSFKDLMRVLGTLILQYVVAISIALILKSIIGMKVNSNPVFDIDMGVKFWLAITVQLFGEELYKILIFLVVLTLMYKYTKKRNLSIAVGLTVSLLCFAFLHATTYNGIVQIILLQGVASLCCFYNYLKSKNILTSYLQHFLFDAIPFILAMVGIMD